MKNATIVRTPYDPRCTDSVLDIFNTPEHQARIQNARRRDYLRSLRHQLMVNGFLVALGFILGALLV